jgi:hypothetical protein
MAFSIYRANQDLPPPARRTINIASASHDLLRRLADVQRVPMTTVLHSALRAEMERCAGAEALAPDPFDVGPVSIDGGFGVRLIHPHLCDVFLTQREAQALALTLKAAGRHTAGARCDFRSAREGTTIRVVQGGRCVHLHVDTRSTPLVRPLAIDLAVALEAALASAIDIGGPTFSGSKTADANDA